MHVYIHDTKPISYRIAGNFQGFEAINLCKFSLQNLGVWCSLAVSNLQKFFSMKIHQFVKVFSLGKSIVD